MSTSLVSSRRDVFSWAMEDSMMHLMHLPMLSKSFKLKRKSMPTVTSLSKKDGCSNLDSMTTHFLLSSWHAILILRLIRSWQKSLRVALFLRVPKFRPLEFSGRKLVHSNLLKVAKTPTSTCRLKMPTSAQKPNYKIRRMYSRTWRERSTNLLNSQLRWTKLIQMTMVT